MSNHPLLVQLLCLLAALLLGPLFLDVELLGNCGARVCHEWRKLGLDVVLDALSSPALLVLCVSSQHSMIYGWAS